jgi:mRNA interferase RelE/StbE
MYTVFIEKRILKDLESLPNAVVERIEGVFISLQDKPRSQGSQKLRGFLSRYRLRQGNCRIVYEIDEERKAVRILIVGHRKDAYREM